MLTIHQEHLEGIDVYTLVGRLDTVTAPCLEKALAASIDSSTEVTLDFEKLEYISSSGLRVLLAAQKAISKYGKMKITHVNDPIQEIFGLTGFADFLIID